MTLMVIIDIRLEAPLPGSALPDCSSALKELSRLDRTERSPPNADQSHKLGRNILMYNRKIVIVVSVIGLATIGLVMAQSSGSHFVFDGMNLRHEKMMAGLYSNDESRVQQLNDAERMQWFSYSLGVLQYLQNKCSIFPTGALNRATAGMLAGFSGGMTAVSLIRDGEADMNAVAMSKGCRSETVQHIARAFED